MKTRSTLLAAVLLAVSAYGFGQDTQSQRTYDFGIFYDYDLRTSSHNFMSAQRALIDGFDALVVSNLPPKIGDLTHSFFGFSVTYLTMLWSHEIGHFIRAKQVGGSFNIHNFGLPVPYTTADLPADITLQNEALFVTAGFEVNYLNVRGMQSQFVRYNGLPNDDLSFSFANRLMYPIYTTLVVPIDPKDQNVWIETAGDPVHYILPVFEQYSGNQVFLPDGTVNPELVSFYYEAMILAMAINLLDPLFYGELGASFGSAAKGRRPIFLIGDFENGWTYGTLFNASPLGYELYLQNYIHVNGRQFGLYLKYGRPFQNIGLGISMNNILNFDSLKADISTEIWQQDIYGFGISSEVNARLKISKHFGLNAYLGYKTAGYVLGKQLESGFNAGAEISIYR